jgi:hypothetical protein
VTLALFLLACAHRPGPAGSGPAGAASTGSTSTTDREATADSGTTPGFATPAAYPDPLPPSVEIFGDPSYGLGGESLAVNGINALTNLNGRPGTLIIGSARDSLWPEMPDYPMGSPSYVISGDIPPGTYHGMDSLWDGSSYHCCGGSTPGDPVEAGDVNGDGEMDYWFFKSLRPGPLVGKQFPYDMLYGDVVGGEILATSPSWPILATQFDANEDGHLDMMVWGPQISATIHYGPIEGDLPKVVVGEPLPPKTSVLGKEGWGCPLLREARVLWDHLGPGHHAVQFGMDDIMCVSPPDSFVFDLMVPPGTEVSYYGGELGRIEGVANITEWMSVKDFTGDGMSEVGSFTVTTLTCVEEAPISGTFVVGDCQHNDLYALFEHRQLAEVMPDLNGDGLAEFIDEDLRMWFSPFPGYSLDESVSVALEDRRAGYSINNFVRWLRPGGYAKDIDGDGLADILWATATKDDDPNRRDGALFIWYGKDLLGAYEYQMWLRGQASSN